jgi:phospholipase C
MEENRSFDHLLGWRPGVDGLNGSEWNYRNISNKAAGKIYAGGGGTTINSCDPDHGLPGTTFKIFGTLNPTREMPPAMDGFVEWEAMLGNSKAQYCNVMSTLNRTPLPVINALADEFVLFDHFFASVPGPTWPNRLFFLCGTSGGQTETSNPWWQQHAGALVPLPTIMTQVEAEGLEWRAYVNDSAWELFVSTLAQNPEKIFMTEEFFEDARLGRLPALSIINPRAGMNFTSGQMANDMHPDHDTSLAEAYYKDIYEALRASPQWNETLFVLTFDEHGGFYDHVPTVLDVPAPDAYPSYPDKFNFQRLGIRIPTLLISPWVARGRVEREPPPAQRPRNDSQYELTSVMATVRKLLGMSSPPLTKRDAWAATFEHLVDQPAPRANCPEHLPDPAPSSYPPEWEARQPVNALQRHMLTVHSTLAGNPMSEAEMNSLSQRDVSTKLQEWFAVHKHNVAIQKRFAAAAPVVRCEPFSGMTPAYLSNSWRANGKLSEGIFSFAPQLDPAHWPIEYCLDAGSQAEGSVVLLTPCNHTSTLPASATQRWLVPKDQSLRPVLNTSLCATTNCVIHSSNTRSGVFLAPCAHVNGTVTQHFTLTPTDFSDNWSRTMQILIGVWALVADSSQSA